MALTHHDLLVGIPLYGIPGIINQDTLYKVGVGVHWECPSLAEATSFGVRTFIGANNCVEAPGFVGHGFNVIGLIKNGIGIMYAKNALLDVYGYNNFSASAEYFKNQGDSVVNYSNGSPGEGILANYTNSNDIYLDYLAVNYPWQTFVQATGNDGYSFYVYHKGYNSIKTAIATNTNTSGNSKNPAS
jgi:hypothetical protein